MSLAVTANLASPTLMSAVMHHSLSEFDSWSWLVEDIPSWGTKNKWATLTNMHNKEISDWHNFRDTVGVPKSYICYKKKWKVNRAPGGKSNTWQIKSNSFRPRLYKSQAPQLPPALLPTSFLSLLPSLFPPV